MVRRAPGASDARVYDVSARSINPLHANLNIGAKSAAAVRRHRRKLELQNTDTDIIQEFVFPTVSNNVKVTADGRYIFASGTYPPQIHVYDTEQLSLKFKRHVDNEIVNFQILENDWRKFVLLTADRYIDFHSPFGSHFKTRVPTFGRDLMLHRGTCDLFVCGDGPQVWRLNLEEGRFLTSISTRSGQTSGNNVCGINPSNALLAFGGDSGLIDIWDPRTVGETQTPAGTVDIHNSLPTGRSATSVTALRFDDRDGVTMAVGTSQGDALLFDLRAPHAVLSREQGNGLAIHSLRLHDDRQHCISADAKSIKIWNRSSGVNLAAIEPDSNVNHVCVIGSSGVICAAVEAPRVKTFYVPTLGAAPKWCSFLDSFTEELENGRSASNGLNTGDGEEDGEEQVYENYKFVTEEELEGLGMNSLIGTEVLKAYMHGYFVHQKLYKRAMEASEPFAYEKYRKQKAKERLEAERESRISKVRKMKRMKKVKVNQNVVDALKEKNKKNKSKKTETDISILQDDRFSAMFSNKDYTVDEDAERFQFLNPNGAAHGTKGKSGQEEDDSDEEYLEQLELDDDDRKGSDIEKLWSSDEESEDEVDEANDSEGDLKSPGENAAIRKTQGRDSKGKQRKRKTLGRDKEPKMYEIEDGLVDARQGRVRNGGTMRGVVDKRMRSEVTLADRVKNEMYGHGRR